LAATAAPKAAAVAPVVSTSSVSLVPVIVANRPNVIAPVPVSFNTVLAPKVTAPSYV